MLIVFIVIVSHCLFVVKVVLGIYLCIDILCFLGCKPQFDLRKQNIFFTLQFNRYCNLLESMIYLIHG